MSTGGAWLQDYCWRKGRPADLLAYCDVHAACDALALFPNGFSFNQQPHCWPSAFFKRRDGGSLSRFGDRLQGGTLDLNRRLMLSPQAVLYVKCSAWNFAMGNSSTAGTCTARRALFTDF